jgi:hypothetical protein
MRAKNILFTILGLLVSSAALAVQQQRLPDFDVTTVDGQLRHSDKLALHGQWLLLYLQPNCLSCESILQLIKRKEDHPELAGRLVIVESGMAIRDLKLLKSRFPELSEAAWYTDGNRSAQMALGLAGVPVVVGVRDMTIQWSLNGILRNVKQYRTILERWARS